MFRSLGPTELFLILAIILLLFGAKKLPDAARGMGRSLRIFKAETKGLVDDEPEQAGPAPTTPRVDTDARQLEAPDVPPQATPKAVDEPRRAE